METNSEKKLTELHELGALQFNTQRLPVYCSHPPEQSRSNLNQIIRLLIQSVPENEHLKKITEQELQIACQSLPSPTQHSLPNHYKPPISRYGTAQFNDQDLHYLRQVRKDHTEVCSVDRIFDIIKRYHESNQYKFSEEAWRDHLHIPMPVEARPLIYSAQRLKSPLSLLFEDLSNKFSKVRDNPTIIASIFSITKHPINLLTMLEEMANLIDSSCQNKEEIESLAIHEAFKTISDTVGASGASSLKVAFLQQQRQTIRNLLHLGNIHFRDLLNTKSKLHHLAQVESYNPVPPLPPPPINDYKLDTLIDSVNRLAERSTICYKCNSNGHLASNCTSNVEKRICHLCGRVGHLQNQCKKKNDVPPKGTSITSNKGSFKNINSNRAMYKDSKCSLHPNSNHLNHQCKMQTSPCTFRPNHSSHSQGECRRNPDQKPSSVPAFSSPAKALFPPPQPAQPAQPVTSNQINLDSLDQQTKAKLIDMIASAK